MRGVGGLQGVALWTLQQAREQLNKKGSVATISSSVPDPDEYAFGPPGSGSLIYLYLYLDPDPSINKQKMKKNHDIFTTFIFEEWCKFTFKKE